MRVPGKGIDAPGLEDAGGCDLLVGDEVGFHAQRLRATCRVEIHCNTTVYTGSEKDRDNSTASKTPQICQKPSPYSHCTAHQGRAGKCSIDMQGCLLPRFLAPSYSLAHSASCCRDEWMSPQHSPALEYRKLWQEAEKDVERAAQRYPQPEARMAPHPRSSRKDPNPSIPLPQRHPTPTSHSVPRNVLQGRNAAGTGKGLRLRIPCISQRTLIPCCFSSSLAGKAAGSQLRRGGGTVKTAGSGRC